MYCFYQQHGNSEQHSSRGWDHESWHVIPKGLKSKPKWATGLQHLVYWLIEEPVKCVCWTPSRRLDILHSERHGQASYVHVFMFYNSVCLAMSMFPWSLNEFVFNCRSYQECYLTLWNKWLAWLWDIFLHLDSYLFPHRIVSFLQNPWLENTISTLSLFLNKYLAYIWKFNQHLVPKVGWKYPFKLICKQIQYSLHKAKIRMHLFCTCCFKYEGSLHCLELGEGNT